ncbi:2-C-methyl-D-erythritol 4-phosphate cytidylyltransferase [Leptospira semungkisensis]|uniref:2-C-methyl-D-erythritol 4-phosphate cytidylyltransferase n=1 Tax=Leptospira semungkisensis TaxID=2484985 RepID=A0A4R9G5E8_9LEPT|nr:IspD/TarI family cytidylyltransferase [Leptospira semungkisensis]TGK06603.1 2-C-methyl-D-erythritol 4-phosphate cytidylyltransferase [Leptospira semungkisensis]
MKSWLPSGNVHVLLLSGGTGSRMGRSVPKQLLELQGKPILLYSLESLLEWGKTKSIILVSHRDYIEETEKICSPYLRDWDRIVEGGETRHASTLAGLSCLQVANQDIVLVHDAARPFVLSDDLDRLAQETETFGVATLATRNYETVMEEQKDSFHFLDREKIWFMKTPQAIRGDVLKKLPKQIPDFEPTDLCTWTQSQEIPSHMVESHAYNLKITRAEDLALAEAILPLFQALAKN